VAEELLATGHDVRLLLRKPLKGPSGALGEAGTAIGDLGDVESLRKAVKGTQAVMHCAARCGVWGPLPDYIETNVMGTSRLLEAARQEGLSYFVHASSFSVVHGKFSLEGVTESRPYSSDPTAPYAYSKTLSEREVLLANGPGFKTVALRPHLIWGPGDRHLLPRLVGLARKKRLFLFSGGPYRVDSLYIDNAAKAFHLALSKLIEGSPIGGQAYFIGQGEPEEIGVLVGKLLVAVGAPPVRWNMPVEVGSVVARVSEWLWDSFGLGGEPPLTKFTLSQLSTSHWPDISKARRELGYSPKVSVEEGLARLAEAVKAGYLKPS
jgi:nucleoside-diphosphate-sugar epimerase